MEPQQVADLAAQLDTDDAVALIEDLEQDDQLAVLRAMEPDDRAAVEEALTYGEETAGRLMQRDLIAVPEHWKVGQVIDYLRQTDELATDFWEVFVVSPNHHPIGTCKLSTILRTPRSTPVSQIMMRKQTLIPVDLDQEEVALKFQKYALISAAVVDPQRAAGRHDHGRRHRPHHPGRSRRGRAAAVRRGRGRHQRAGDRYLQGAGALACGEPDDRAGRLDRDPLLRTFDRAAGDPGGADADRGGVGGNAGTQTLAVTVRAIATNQLTGSNRWRAVWREIQVALLNGLTIAVLIGIGVTLVLGNPALGGVIAAAMMTNIVVAGFAGVMVPLALERAGADPAVASSVFVTMVTDSMGFLIFLGLATAVGLVG